MKAIAIVLLMLCIALSITSITLFIKVLKNSAKQNFNVTDDIEDSDIPDDPDVLDE